MDESWRFRPIQGSICPTCSISHFPFCYQPPPFNQFPSNPPLNRPVLDPICDNRGIPRPLSHFGNDGFGMLEPLKRNQSFDNRALQPNPNFGYGGNGFVRGEFVDSDRNHKRMRVGDMSSIPVSGSFVQMSPPFGRYSGSHHGKISSEDERRLSLIRDHGAPSSAMQLHVGSNGYMHESSRSCWQPRFSGNDKMTSFPDFRFGSADRTGPTQSMVFDEKKELQRGGSDLGFGHQTQMPKNMQSDVDAAGVGNREESGKELLFESQKEQSQHPGYGAATYITPSQHIMNSSAVCQENKHDQWGDHAFFPLQNDGHGQHSHDGHQQLLPNNFGQANQLQHPQGNNLLASSNSHISASKIHNLHYHDLQNDTRPSFDVKYRSMENINMPVRPHNLPNVEQSGLFRVNQPGTYLHVSATNNVVPARQSQMTSSQPVVVQPPLPPLPPHPRQYDSPVAPLLHLQVRSSSPNVSSVYPGSTASSVTMPLSSLPLEGQLYMPKHPSPDKPKVVDASRLFLPPDRATRPDHIVIILRGFPGSGKSYLAKKLRDLEVENGGSAPRIHSMDDYFMTEVEKVEEVDNPSMAKGKKRTTKKVMEYCYEPEMEEAYRSSMLKAFKKTLEEGIFTFVIVDDRNLRVADFAQFWASAKRSGYEVYLLEASYKDPMGCAARNVHGFTSDDVQKMAELWEEAPSLYLLLDVQSLFCGDNLKESEIQEVEMDMEDASSVGGSSELSNNYSLKVKEPPITEDCAPEAEVSFKDERWDAEGDDPTRVKELGRSKWSHDEDEEDNERVERGRGNSNALSGLIKAYSKGEKSVHWGDQVGKTGFSIGAAKKATSLSLIIGPGAGYNVKSNPPLVEENATASEQGWQSKKRNVFEEQLRAERESFRAVFDRRRHRIGGLDTDDE